MLRRKSSKRPIWKGLLFVVLSLIIAFTAAAQDFTIVVLPDTQNYSAIYPATFTNQTQWIVDNKDTLNIVYVAHEGDIVNTASSSEQWNNAVAAMSLLENPVTTGLPDGIPYGVVPGNHDEPTTNYNTYFGVSRFSNRDYYGNGYPSGYNDSNYTFFSASGMDFIVVNLEYATPSSGLLGWADNLLKNYSNRRAIVVTHYILNTDGSFGSWGQQVYNALKDNPNLFLMLCGHMHGEAMRSEVYNWNTVHILLADYQDQPNGGNGWLRIMKFSPENNEIAVTTYSPLLDQYGANTAMGVNTTSEVFTISYNMDNCPNDPDKTEPGICGCGVPDVDTDSDGTFDCNDNCPNDPNKTGPAICGCGIADTDSDGDGIPDCNDLLPGVNDYKGTYSGTYTGDDNGTWSVSIAETGNGTAYSYSNLYNRPYVGLGSVDTDGSFTLYMDGGAVINGTIAVDGSVAGSWTNDTEGGTIEGALNSFDSLAELAGTYKGTYTGPDSGTWSATINDVGFVSGSSVSSFDGERISGDGNANTAGEIYAELNNGTILYGVLNSDTKAIQGVWYNPILDMGGTLSGDLQIAPAATTDGGGGGCFIATAAYGSLMEPHVKILREFRDHFLIVKSIGKGFVRLYYAYSPPIAEFIAKHDSLRAMVRISLLPVVGVSWVALKIGPVSTVALMLIFISCFVGLVSFRRRYKE